jgi:hypothetical protein
MRDLDRAIREASTIEEMGDLLCELSHDIRETIEKRTFSEGWVYDMAAHVTQVRVMLRELGKKDLRECCMGRELADRYLELEGRLKEIRNDLGRVAK